MDHKRKNDLIEQLWQIGVMLAVGLSVVLIVLALALRTARADEQQFIAVAQMCGEGPEVSRCDSLYSPGNPFPTLAACKEDIATFNAVMLDKSGIAEKWTKSKHVTTFSWIVGCIDSNGVAHHTIAGTVRVGGQDT